MGRRRGAHEAALVEQVDALEIREARANRVADEQCAGQTRTLRIGNRVDGIERDLALGQYLFQQRYRTPYVIARRQLRHHAAVVGVHGNLRVQPVAQQATLRVVQGQDRKSTRLNSSHMSESRMPSSA